MTRSSMPQSMSVAYLTEMCYAYVPAMVCFEREELMVGILWLHQKGILEEEKADETGRIARQI